MVTFNPRLDTAEMQRRFAGVKNCIFDLDGTLIDSMEDILGAQLRTFASFGQTQFTKEELRRFIGRPFRHTLTTLFPSHLHDRIQEAIDMYLASYRARMYDTTKPYRGVVETLEILSVRGYNLAVATSKSTVTTEAMLKQMEMDHLFVQVSATDGGPYKPDPAVVNRVIDTQKWNRAETVMVGDSDADIGAGRNAGVLTCAVTYGALPREMLVAAEPDALIDVFPALKNLLGMKEE